jgi:Fic family protein
MIMAETTVKMTKKDWYELIKGIVAESEAEQKAEMIDFIDAQLDQLVKKAEKAKERAGKVKEEGDELRELVASLLTLDFQTADALTAQIEGEGITKAKVTARLTQLVKAGVAMKEVMKAEDGRKVMHYRAV